MGKRKFPYGLLAVVVCGALYTGGALAATSGPVAGGTITFSGAVTDTTCNVTTNNGSDFTVSLDPITVDAAGTTTGVISAGATSFNVSVSGCEGYDATNTTAQALQVSFSGSNISDDEKYLKNESGTANGIGIVITSDGTSAVSLNKALSTGLATTSSDGTNYDTGVAGDTTWYANYYNYGGTSVSTGSVISSVTYTFSYE